MNGMKSGVLKSRLIQLIIDHGGLWDVKDVTYHIFYLKFFVVAGQKRFPTDPGISYYSGKLKHQE